MGHVFKFLIEIDEPDWDKAMEIALAEIDDSNLTESWEF
jgi:hypothetical protein